MNISRDRYGLPQVRNAWGTPPPPVGRVGTVYRQAYRQALPDVRPSVGRVRPGYRHTFSPAPAPVARVQTGYRQPSPAPRSAQRVRPVNSGSVARFRRMIANPGPNLWDSTRIFEKETEEMELWFEDYKEKMLRIELEQKKVEQQKERDMFNRLYMQDIPIFQQNAELKEANDVLRLKIQQKDELKSESDAFKQTAELKSENDELKLKIEAMRQAVKHDFECPISTVRFETPVVALDGHTYEAECIVDWFERGNHSSPLTNEELVAPNLVHNFTLMKVMKAFEE